MKPLVVVTRKIPGSGIDLLKKHYRVKVSPHNRALSRKEFLKLVKGADAILSLLTDKVDSEVFDAAGEQLKIVANYAVGFDNIDLKEANKRGILVSNTPGVLTQAVVELTLALMLSAVRRTVEGDRFIRAGKYKGWDPGLFLGFQLEGKTLGIIGLGRIGSGVAEAAALGYKMKVIYHDVMGPDKKLDKKINAKFVEKDDLLKEADIISLHVPLTKSTHHLMGKGEFKKMKNTAVLINTSRGAVINEKDLAEALRAKTIWSAGIDVFEFEPKVTPQLKKMDNIIMTPHIGSSTEEARVSMGDMAVQNIIAAFEGKKLISEVQ